MRTPLKLLSVVGARPNFMKIAPFVRALERWQAAGHAPAFDHTLVHTGQHYDPAMSERFFETLRIPPPHLNLEIGSGSHAEQVGRTMIALEGVLQEQSPDWVLVVGDVNATCASAITAKKLGLRLAHLEAGLRSFDMRMPEEINRIVTDRLADLLLTPDAFAEANLRREGTAETRIAPVGNIMIDTLDANRPAADALNAAAFLTTRAGSSAASTHTAAQAVAQGCPFGVVTLHRPSNVDTRERLTALTRFLADEAVRELPLVWSLHPRTRARLRDFGLWESLKTVPDLLLIDPLDYLEMLHLNARATLFLTDSGGLQEECCVLGTPCLTLRTTTERPVTLEEHGGVSRLVGNDIDRLRDGFHALRRHPRRPFRPSLWDGATGDRVVAALAAAG